MNANELVRLIEMFNKPGVFAIVDEWKYDEIMTFSKFWHYDKNGYVYVNTKDSSGKRWFVYLHRFVLGLAFKPANGLVVDHENRNTLDNRWSNLRHVTQAVNQLNRYKKAKGVSFSHRRQTYAAQITRNGKNHNGPARKTKEEAIADYNKMLEDLNKKIKELGLV